MHGILHAKNERPRGIAREIRTAVLLAKLKIGEFAAIELRVKCDRRMREVILRKIVGGIAGKRNNARRPYGTQNRRNRSGIGAGRARLFNFHAPPIFLAAMVPDSFLISNEVTLLLSSSSTD